MPVHVLPTSVPTFQSWIVPHSGRGEQTKTWSKNGISDCRAATIEDDSGQKRITADESEWRRGKPPIAFEITGDLGFLECTHVATHVLSGGGSGIRTHDTVSRIHAFQ